MNKQLQCHLSLKSSKFVMIKYLINCKIPEFSKAMLGFGPTYGKIRKGESENSKPIHFFFPVYIPFPKLGFLIFSGDNGNKKPFLEFSYFKTYSAFVFWPIFFYIKSDIRKINIHIAQPFSYECGKILREKIRIVYCCIKSVNSLHLNKRNGLLYFINISGEVLFNLLFHF
ncbi:hypothetical protein CW304_21340 [Bacillus sp. UFRGS-B20]|nr:hypothetical protein CW304_21340 [Bacillus sp. UFRGS-B20]